MSMFKGDNGPHVIAAHPAPAEDAKPAAPETQDTSTRSNEGEVLGTATPRVRVRKKAAGK